ncbi:MAG: helix-turn-helix domain-containing protein [Ginsengibacter sp.]
METLFIPNENDFKRWIKEAVKDFLQEFTKEEFRDKQKEENLLNRKEIAKFLRVSLPTLTDWIKRGLPSHKQRGRVYFDKTEVIKYIKENKIGQLKFSSRFETLRQEIA